ncbi:MAG: Glu-tRNA(Gln) amidotransferase subunit GatD [Candidatus Bathyarchaeia archaeon]|nr:Glu-tRNA(Gln) amidotransferase subunit GatD [Candidatus Bathyarchaeota archaeon]
MEERLPGYRGLALKALLDAGAEIGDLIRIIKDDVIFEGILIPRSEYSDDRHIVIKNRSGYNIGVEVTPSTRIERIGAEMKPAFIPPPPPKQRPGLPRVSILSTGGTIASRVDYRTGAVRPVISASDLYSIVPELADIAVIDAEILFSVFSEDLTPKHWSAMAEAVARHITRGVDGVIIAHGTDTMGYSAAALSFALQNLPVPVVLVGAQRSEDRPSSDAPLNLIGAVLAASRAPFAEVTVAMHETPSDDSIILHRGTKVRKCHTSRRDAFKTVNAKPLARVIGDRIIMLTNEYRPRDTGRRLVLRANFDERATLIKFYPGMNPKIIDWYVSEGYRGIVLEGTGLGHVRRECFPAIKRAIESGVIVGMTSQCIWGRINMNVYSNGRDLLAMGVIPLGDMLAETALVKMMWCLAQSTDPEEVKRLLLTNLAGEISERTVEPIEAPRIFSPSKEAD